MRSLVLGLEAVLPDGTVHDGLTALKKDNRGYSLDQLLIGSEGTWGSSPRRRSSWCRRWRRGRSPGPESPIRRRRSTCSTGCKARATSSRASKIIPAASLDLVLRHTPGTRSPLAGQHRWHVLIEATSADAAEPPAAELERMLGEALAHGQIADAALASSEAQAEAFWRIRNFISEAERASGGSVAHDISVPVDAMPRFMIAAADVIERAFPGVEASAFGHLGDGNVHFHVRGGNPAEAPAITRMVDDLVTAAGGSISAEHGIGQAKLDEFERLAPPGRIAALKAIKHALDPAGLMNPGKLVR